MDLFLQFAINGLTQGAAYTLVAAGLTLIFSVMRIVNFAHGEFYMLGGYATFFIITALGGHYLIALAAAAVLIGLLGAAVERLCFRPLHGKPHINMLLMSIALLIVLQNTVAAIWTANHRIFQTGFSGRTLQLWGGRIVVTYDRLLVVAAGFGLMLLLHLFIKRSRIGKAIRAVAQDREAASVVGVEIDRISTVTFALGSALAAVAGGLLGPIFSVSPFMGALPTVKAFTVILIAGLGNISGSAAVGLCLGLAENLLGGYFLYEYVDAFSFVLLILVLVFRPQGFLTSATPRR